MRPLLPRARSRPAPPVLRFEPADDELNWLVDLVHHPPHSPVAPGVGHHPGGHDEHGDRQHGGAHHRAQAGAELQAAPEQRDGDLGADRHGDGEQRPTSEGVALGRAQRVVVGGVEEGGQVAFVVEDRGHGRRGQDQRERTLQPLVGEREIDHERERQRERAAAREREEEGEQEEDEDAGEGASRRHRQAAARGALERRQHGHHEHDGQHVPVADGSAQASVEVGVRNHIRQHFPEDRVRRDRDHDAGEAVAGQAQLSGAGRRDRRDSGDDQVQQGDVEGHPRQVGPHRPGDRQPLPEGEQRQCREGDEGGRIEAGPARRKPDPDCRQRHEDEYDRCRPGKDVAARKE